MNAKLLLLLTTLVMGGISLLSVPAEGRDYRFERRRERLEAARLPLALQAVREMIESKKKLNNQRVRKVFLEALGLPSKSVDYVEVVDPETLKPLRSPGRPGLIAAAVWTGRTRLIDNLLVR